VDRSHLAFLVSVVLAVGGCDNSEEVGSNPDGGTAADAASSMYSSEWVDGTYQCPSSSPYGTELTIAPSGKNTTVDWFQDLVLIPNQVAFETFSVESGFGADVVDGGWKADETVTVDIPDNFGSHSCDYHVLLFLAPVEYNLAANNAVRLDIGASPATIDGWCDAYLHPQRPTSWSGTCGLVTAAD
jgi:hypothetical protein